jgi:hypothetical protein
VVPSSALGGSRWGDSRKVWSPGTWPRRQGGPG